MTERKRERGGERQNIRTSASIDSEWDGFQLKEKSALPVVEIPEQRSHKSNSNSNATTLKSIDIRCVQEEKTKTTTDDIHTMKRCESREMWEVNGCGNGRDFTKIDGERETTRSYKRKKMKERIYKRSSVSNLNSLYMDCIVYIQEHFRIPNLTLITPSLNSTRYEKSCKGRYVSRK